jgi:hypothetical protein
VLAQRARDADGFNRFVRGEIHFFFHRKGREGRKGIKQAHSLVIQAIFA